MDESPIVTCPKHGLQYNRLHYRECEKCRGAHIQALNVETPFDPIWLVRAKWAGGALAGLLVVYLAVTLTGGKARRAHAPPGSAVVSLGCAQTCTDRAEECIGDCASVREDSCSAGCLPQMQQCVNRCKPPISLPGGIAVISSGPKDPALDAALQRAYDAWPVDDLPSLAYVRLTIGATTGAVRGAQVQSNPESAAESIAQHFTRVVFPPSVDPNAPTLGRDERTPRILYVALTR